VFGIGPATRIYLALGATDMRKGFEGLYGLVRDRLQQEPLSGCERRRKNRIKPTILKSDGGLGVGDDGRCVFRKGRLSAFDTVFHAVAGAFD